jgi:urea transport system permease protein
MSGPSGLRSRLLTPQLPWRLVFAAVVVIVLLMPQLLSPYRLDLLAKYLCLAILAIGIGLAWGYGGMLTLGQGLFFGLGAYSMGMYLLLEQAGPNGIPDFMRDITDFTTLPAFWEPFRNPVFVIAMVIFLPALVAGVLGYLIFRQRVRGAYFAILTQALAAAFAILLVGQLEYTNGTNGLTGFRRFFGIKTATDEGERILYFIAAGVLLAVFLLLRLLVRSRFGRLLLAVRDGEDRVRFLGYDPTVVKTITFAISAVTASVAGALFAPIVGIVNPGLLGVVPSIGFVLAVAVGGRFSLIGAMAGAIVVNWASTSLSEDFPEFWTYFQGALFIVVIAFLPKGLAGLFRTVGTVVGREAARRGAALPFPREPELSAHSGEPGADAAAGPPGQPAVGATEGGPGTAAGSAETKETVR